MAPNTGICHPGRRGHREIAAGLAVAGVLRPRNSCIRGAGAMRAKDVDGRDELRHGGKGKGRWATSWEVFGPLGSSLRSFGVDSCNRALFEKPPQGLDLLLGLDLQAFPINEAVVERGVVGARDHPARELGLFIEHAESYVKALLDSFRLSLDNLRRAKAMPDMAAVLSQAILEDKPQCAATFGAAEAYRGFKFAHIHPD